MCSIPALLAIAAIGFDSQAGSRPWPPDHAIIEGVLPVTFVVPTNGGDLTGTIDMVSFDARGLNGTGRFNLRGVLDPKTLRTGDSILEDYFKRHVLQEDKGLLHFGSVQRVPSSPENPKPGFGMFLDPTRGSRYVEIRPKFEHGEKKWSVVMVVDESISATALGLKGNVHPFLKVTGPVHFTVRIPLVAKKTNIAAPVATATPIQP